MMSFSVKGDVDDILFDLDEVQESVVPKVIANSLNTVVFEGRAEALKRTATNIGINPYHLRSRARVVKAGKGDSSATIRIYNAPFVAEKLNYSASKAHGVKAGNVHFPRGFEATMKSGHKGVYQRKGKARLPIAKLSIPLQPLLDNHTINTLRETSFYFVDIFDEEMERALEGGAANE